MNSYEAKQERRRERLEAAADRAEARANAAYKRADMSEESTGIPFGQPILVGHHSEGKHRRAIARADAAMRKSIDESKRAGDLRARAASVGSGGISSDDPDAIEKLRQKLNKLEAAQTFMRAANRHVRRAQKDGAPENIDAVARLASALAELSEGFGEREALSLLQPDFAGRVGFANYQFSNGSAEIRRIKQRLAQIERNSQRETKRTEYQGVCSVVENTEENRLQFIFDGKPSAEIRAKLKSCGFRWSPSEGAWQRQLNNNARYSARFLLRALGVEA